MSYIEIFAKGGKTNAELITKIQELLGADDAQMQELWQMAIEKYGSEEGIAAALEEATSGLTAESSEEDIRSAIASVFTESMFKCGGKLEQLASKFAKGGKVDCGCGKTKMEKCGGKVKKKQAGGTFDPNWKPKGINFQPYWMYNMVNGNDLVRNYYLNSAKSTTNPIEAKPVETKPITNPIPKSSVSTTPVQLTRNQALELGMQNKGFTRAQAQLGYQNAKNALRNNSDLRGEELRTAARNMVAGIEITPTVTRSISTSVATPTVNVPTITGPIRQITEERSLRLGNLTDEQLAEAVIAGKYGVGEERKKNLGERYAPVQRIINQRLRSNKPTVTPKPISKPIEEPIAEPVNNPVQPIGTPQDWTAGWRSVADRQPSMTEADKIAIQNKKQPWIVKVTQNAAYNENPAVMTASGWKHDKNGNVYQTVPTEEEQQLGKNLAAIGAAGIAGLGLNAGLGAIPMSAAEESLVNFVPEYVKAANGAIKATNTGRWVNSAITTGKYAPYMSDLAATFGFKCGGKVEKDQSGKRLPDAIPIGKNPRKAIALAEKAPYKLPPYGRAIKRRVGLATDLNGGQYVYENAVVGGNTAETLAEVPQPGDTILTQSIATKHEPIVKTYLPGSDEYKVVMERLRPLFKFIPKEQKTPNLKCGGKTKKKK